MDAKHRTDLPPAYGEVPDTGTPERAACGDASVGQGAIRSEGIPQGIIDRKLEMEQKYFGKRASSPSEASSPQGV